MSSIPTHQQLSEAAGFPVPESLVRAWKAAALLNPKDPANGLENFGSGLSLFVPDESEEFDDFPCECVAFARLIDGALLAFVLDDAAETPIERPVVCVSYVGTGPDIYGMSLPGAISFMMQFEPEEELDDRRMEEMRVWLDHLAPDKNEPTREPHITRARWRQGAIWTPDNIGVVVPEDSIDRAFLSRIVWPHPGTLSRPLSPKPIVLDEAEKRLSKGEPGTALVLARNYRHFWAATTESVGRTGDLMSRAYLALGRKLQAAKVKRQTASRIAKDFGPR